MQKRKKFITSEPLTLDGWSIAAFIYAIIIFAAVVVIFVGIVRLAISSDAAKYEYEHTVYYEVEQGDTLWTIASKYTVEKQDVRRVIEIIKNLNNCDSSIYPGDWLEIPDFS